MAGVGREPLLRKEERDVEGAARVGVEVTAVEYGSYETYFYHVALTLCTFAWCLVVGRATYYWF